LGARHITSPVRPKPQSSSGCFAVRARSCWTSEVVTEITEGSSEEAVRRYLITSRVAAKAVHLRLLVMVGPKGAG
jgi:hypothetical protein